MLRNFAVICLFFFVQGCAHQPDWDFDQSIDLKEQKQKIFNKTEELKHKIFKMNEKLKNKSFLKNAPKQIVNNEKKALIDYKGELKKLNSILNSIKN